MIPEFVVSLIPYALAAIAAVIAYFKLGSIVKQNDELNKANADLVIELQKQKDAQTKVQTANDIQVQVNRLDDDSAIAELQRDFSRDQNR